MKSEELEKLPHFVYRTWDAAGRLLYIGCSINVENRLKDHKTWRAWYSDMATFTVEGPYTYTEARLIEWAAIQTERSLHNAQSHERRAHSRLGNQIWNVAYATALANGEPWPSAMHQATIVRDLETPPIEEFFARLDAAGIRHTQAWELADEMGREFASERAA